MKRLRDFFDRHGKLRIALQLLLDISPLLLLAWAAPAVLTKGYGLTDVELMLQSVAIAAFLFLTVPLFVVSYLLARNLVEFDVYPAWGKVSLALRWLSVVPLLIAIALDLMLIATVLDVAWYLSMWLGSR